jgi:predicted nucleic acid-binding protein
MACTFDTNILVYTLPDPRNANRELARNLLIRAARPGVSVLLLQSLAEFSSVAARKFGLDIASIHRRVRDWRDVIPVHAAGEDDLFAALDLARTHRLGFWDALMCATASRAGLRYFLTEDLQDGRRLGNLTIVNPFLPGNGALIDQVLSS